MKKQYLILLLVVVLLPATLFNIGMFISGFSRVKVKQEVKSIPKKIEAIHYNDEVEVVNGFFTGVKGKVVGRGSCGCGGILKVALKQPEGKFIEVSEKYLKKIQEEVKDE